MHGTDESLPAAEPAGEQAGSDSGRPAAQVTGQVTSWLTARFPAHRRLPLATYLVCQLIYLFWWLAFHPGLLTYDSVTYVLHVTAGPWVDNHSVLYDCLVWLSLHATGGLAVLSLAQTIAMSAALAYAVSAFRRIGVPGWWTSGAAVVVAGLPPLASFVIYIWKDVPFVICSFLVVPTLARLISLRQDGRWPAGPLQRVVAALGLELLGICLFRLNGFVVAAIAVVVMVIVLRGLRVRVAAVGAAAVVIAVVLNTYVYPAVGIQRTPSSMALAPVYSDIAVAYSKDPAIFTAAELAVMRDVAPLRSWSQTATCYDTVPTMAIPGFAQRSEPVAGQLTSLWLALLRRSPRLIIDARICRGSIAWNILPGPARTSGYTIMYDPPASLAVHDSSRVPHNPYRDALALRPLSWRAYHLASSMWRASMAPGLDWLLWRGALWAYLSYLAVALAALLARNRALLALGAVVFGQQLAVAAENDAQSFRYMAAPIIIGIMLTGLLVFSRRLRPAPAD